VNFAFTVERNVSVWIDVTASELITEHKKISTLVITYTEYAGFEVLISVVTKNSCVLGYTAV
jgi:hypothetical protein